MTTVRCHHAFCFEGYVLDLTRGCLRVGDREIDLRPKSFALLRYFVENAGRLLSKDEIAAAVWPTVAVTDDSLTRCVSEVRSALGDGEQRIVRTMQRRGYLFAAAVTGLAANTALAPGAVPSRLSIVVLPFANLSGDGEQDYFVDAITDILTTDLSRIPGSFVIARHTAFTLKGMARDVKQVGRELGVRYVMEGSVQTGRARIRVNVQLIDAETGAHLWAEHFDKPRADALDMQNEITARLARSLGVELVAAESRRVERERPGNVDAMDLALRGWACLNQVLTIDVVRESRRFFEAALRIDEHNVDALIGLADAHTFEIMTYDTANRAEQLHIAETAISKALAIAPERALGHYAHAGVLLARQAPEQALRTCELAVGFDRNLAVAHAFIGQIKISLGRAAETEAHVNHAMRLSPRDPRLCFWYLTAGFADLILDRIDRGLERLRLSVQLNPRFWMSHVLLAGALVLAGRHTEALSAAAAGRRLNPGHGVAGLRTGSVYDDRSYAGRLERIADAIRQAGASG